MTVQPPAPRPCVTCPYRRDVPSAVWDREEYDKLPEFDGPTYHQPPCVFLCHQQDGRLCAGWTAVHDMAENLGIRIALGQGLIDESDIDEIMGYTTSVPLFASGHEAAAHGLANLKSPGKDAVQAIGKLQSKLGKEN